ncbi:MAG TPA: peptidase MA domain-containing protein [Dehalococcoidia bacterium]|nr:peptidase MA domain-containing protein [Dehalococcoidia bacterium]
MKHKIGLLITLGLILVVALWNPCLVQASSELSILDYSAEIDFPVKIIFEVSARSDVDIDDIRLHYRINRTELARITSEVYIEFTPSKTVSIDWVWDMRKTGGLPPGSSLYYWWTVTDADGDSVQTPPVEMLVSDKRYDWQELTEGEITLYWYKGDDSFSGELMAAAQEALARLYVETGAELEKPVSIYIYASSADLQGSMIFPQEWTGGVAFTRYGIITIGIGTSSGDMEWGKRAIAHELTHLVIHQITLNPYNDLPVWLDEGLAMNTEGELLWYFMDELNKARENGTFFSVRSLASPFPTDTNEALLSYAQSYELVKFLIDEYGQEKMFELLSTFREGAGYDEALNRVYNFDMDGLDARWRAAFEAMVIL